MIPYSIALSVHLLVQKAILPKRESPDVWTEYVIYEDSVYYGDCEDYALTKRRKLLDMGYSHLDMSLIITSTTEKSGWFTVASGHMVLAIKTDVGWMILDNLYEIPYAYNGGISALYDKRWYQIRTDKGLGVVTSPPDLWQSFCRSKKSDPDC